MVTAMAIYNAEFLCGWHHLRSGKRHQWERKIMILISCGIPQSKVDPTRVTTIGTTMVKKAAVLNTRHVFRPVGEQHRIAKNQPYYKILLRNKRHAEGRWPASITPGVVDQRNRSIIVREKTQPLKNMLGVHLSQDRQAFVRGVLFG